MGKRDGGSVSIIACPPADWVSFFTKCPALAVAEGARLEALAVRLLNVDCWADLPEGG